MRHASPDDINGRLEVVFRHYAAAASQSVIRKLDLQTSAASATVLDIVTAVVNPSSRTGFRDFCFANGGMGCRYWHTTMACLYEASRFVPPGTALMVFEFLSWLYTRVPNQASRATIIIPGSFDSTQVQRQATQLWRSTISPLARERWVSKTFTTPDSRRSLRRSLEQGRRCDRVDLLAHQQAAYQRLGAARLQSERVEEVVD
ncbi:hypothetical protein CERZMDRAFT_86622 [Cercospora zeae-maydis SCOH1-5]|uniref:DUF7770 domain-containing protein n=1 Tax=Cercospora zeae-maydis SCOH1-5 TaxID=717836 RepID=A0A6A6F9C8_9PEZI|nr:hypothetical protein CERZMDRAFT_86622 [Cercospora zeae-maydis SCOH1-5]